MKETSHEVIAALDIKEFVLFCIYPSCLSFKEAVAQKSTKAYQMAEWSSETSLIPVQRRW